MHWTPHWPTSRTLAAPLKGANVWARTCRGAAQPPTRPQHEREKYFAHIMYTNRCSRLCTTSYIFVFTVKIESFKLRIILTHTHAVNLTLLKVIPLRHSTLIGHLHESIPRPPRPFQRRACPAPWATHLKEPGSAFWGGLPEERHACHQVKNI